MEFPTVSGDDIAQAAKRLEPHIQRTPLLHSPLLDKRCRGRILLKAECLQVTGSFKLRGALNRLLSLTDEERQKGVVAYSSGNHAQGVAMAASITGVQATIVMPEDAPTVKTERTRRLGAEIVTYDRLNESREDIAADLAETRGAVLVPPFDDPHIIAGQGTAGLEIREECERTDTQVDQVVVCCSGGGLASGIGLALNCGEAGRPQMITAEPNGFDDMRRSLIAGSRLSNPPGGASICDALLVPTPGALTFPILQRLNASGVTVSDREVMGAIRFAAEELRVLIEPGGAVI